MDRAMHPGTGVLPDRVPVMCQLALGHYFLNTDLDPVDVWHDTPSFGDALIALQQRYGFDGILVNLPGRQPDWRRLLRAVEYTPAGAHVRWSCGRTSVVPPDENPYVYEDESGRKPCRRLEEIESDRLFYVEPHGLTGLCVLTSPVFPPWQWDTIRYVRSRAPEVSVHGEVFSPFSQFMELLDCAPALLALMLEPAKALACLARLAEGTIVLARGYLDAGADAVLISSAFAGAGFLSRDHYRQFVLPFERQVVEGVRQARPGRPIYTHTCGAIGDRLDLLEETGTHGIDALDPPPLGTIDLAEARRRLGTRVFIKGNIDPVNTVLRGTPEACYAAAIERLDAAAAGGGYILSTACSVPPHAPPANVLALVRACDERGQYDR
jgi:hypothetical protein